MSDFDKQCSWQWRVRRAAWLIYDDLRGPWHRPWLDLARAILLAAGAAVCAFVGLFVQGTRSGGFTWGVSAAFMFMWSYEYAMDWWYGR